MLKDSSAPPNEFARSFITSTADLVVFIRAWSCIISLSVLSASDFGEVWVLGVDIAVFGTSVSGDVAVNMFGIGYWEGDVDTTGGGDHFERVGTIPKIDDLFFGAFEVTTLPVLGCWFDATIGEGRGGIEGIGSDFFNFHKLVPNDLFFFTVFGVTTLSESGCLLNIGTGGIGGIGSDFFENMEVPTNDRLFLRDFGATKPPVFGSSSSVRCWEVDSEIVRLEADSLEEEGAGVSDDRSSS